MSKIRFFALDARIQKTSLEVTQTHRRILMSKMEFGGPADELFDIISNIVLIGSLAWNVSIEAEGFIVVPEKHLATEIFHFTPICCCFFEDLMNMDYKRSKRSKLGNVTYNNVHIAILMIFYKPR